ncbi:MAG: glutamine amidotransferase [Candidatus Limnocylindrales bacterium]
MSTSPEILIAGESWVTHSIHQKGFDSFTTTSYSEGVGPLRTALEAGGFEVHYLPNHVAARDFPDTSEALSRYAAIILSDIGSNTLLLHPETFERSAPRPDRLRAIEEYVAGGGGLVMVGGYLTFAGIEGRARWAGTPVEAALPVTITTLDDRVEVPSGVAPQVHRADHPIVAGLPDDWPDLLGYNRVAARAGADTVVSVGDDPLIVAGQHGDGRGAVFTSDCGPHWCPPPFVEWPGYAPMWQQLLTWVSRSA